MKYLAYISNKEKLNEIKLLCVINELDMENDLLKKDLHIIHILAKNCLIRIEVVEDSKVNELQANMILKGFSSYPQGNIITLYNSVLDYLFHINEDFRSPQEMSNIIMTKLRQTKNEDDVEKILDEYRFKTKAIRK